MPKAEGLDYEEHGGGTKGPPLVFIHGAGGDRLHWPAAVRRLEGAHTFALDLPGHGRSPAGGEVRIEDFAARVLSWWRSVGGARPVLVGHSMGSAIALTAAFSEPQAIAGLVLVGAGARLRVNPVLLEETGRAGTFESAVEKILAWSFSAQASPSLPGQARRSMLRAGSVVLHRDLQACDAFDVGGRLREVRLPTLIIVGSQDRMTPPRLSAALQEGLPDSRLEMVEGAGHMVMLEQPEVVAGLLLRFSSEVGGALQ